MDKFICTSEPYNAKDINGKPIGIQPKRALFYSKSVGKGRIYRSDYESPSKVFKIFEFTSIEKAKELCDGINKAYNDNFNPEKLSSLQTLTT